jgi:oligopeptide/dipeptide ABC transporter ATP-binding protein
MSVPTRAQDPAPVAVADLLEVRDVRKWFSVPGSGGHRARLKAVDGVSLTVGAGETLGLVGESGCGKSTLGRLVLGVTPPTGGTISWDGREIQTGRRGTAAPWRREIQIIFQDPYSSLNPRMSIGAILAEPFIIHGVARGREAESRAEELLVRVGLSSEDAFRYPHEFSGGQRQRIGIARALALSPRLIVADEPVSSLDVSIQAQILNLLMDLRDETGVGYLFISHDLSVIRHISHRVAVMYLGRLVEVAPAAELFERPHHPYTEALLAAVPRVGDRWGDKKIVLAGDIPSPVDPPAGCHFHPRCPIRGEGCDRTWPELHQPSAGRLVACHYRG